MSTAPASKHRMGSNGEICIVGGDSNIQNTRLQTLANDQWIVGLLTLHWGVL
jgi:hypothetical protein